jgi:hypothetical protein
MSQALPACIRKNRTRYIEELREFIRIPAISTPLAPTEKLRIGSHYSGILTVTRFLEKCGAA